MIKTRKYTLINIAILFVGILIGILLIISYEYSSEQKNAVKRDTYINFLNETSLLINKNQALYQEIEILNKDIEESKTTYQAYKNAEETIDKLQMLLGLTEVSGEGVEIEVRHDLPYYMIVDLINDLYTIGAEVIDINNVRISDNSSLTENIVTKQVSISHTPISSPFLIKVIGDSDTLYKNLEKKHSILNRIQTAYNIKDKDLQFSKEAILNLPKA